MVDRQTSTPSLVLAELENQAWAELVLRSLARETNLLLPTTRFLLVGTGALSERLATALSRIGGLVELASDDPVALLLTARRTSTRPRLLDEKPVISADDDVVIVAGTDHPPLTSVTVEPADRPLVVLDATPPGGDASWPGHHAATTVRNLQHLPGPRPIFVVPAPASDQLDRAVAEVRADFAVLEATVGAHASDIALATRLLR